MNIKKIAIGISAGAILFGSLAGSAFAVPVATAPGQNKIVCFQSGAATCTLNNSGAKGSATLTVTGAGDASVYFTGFNDSIYGVLLSDVTQLSFMYTGTATGGAPRLSIPIDEDNAA